MSEGPVSFGKPLMWIVILGCAGGGVYAYKTWPVTYEGSGWSVKLPNGWEAGSANDPTDGTRVVGKGPLKKTPAGEEQEGVMWARLQFHGALDWDSFVRNNLPGTADWTQDVDIDYKKARLFIYEDQNVRWYGAAVDRVDAMIFVAIGTNKTNFPIHQPTFEKVIQSIRCQR